MSNLKDLRSECNALYHQAESFLVKIDKVARDFNTSNAWERTEEVHDTIARLRSDLAELHQNIEGFKTVALNQVGSGKSGPPDASIPVLIGGIATGVLLGKLLGSKSQLDLLPFLVGLELGSDLNPV